MPVSSSLRERRLACGLTQAELAARAGVSRQLIAAVEAGRNIPAVDAALGLAKALATTVEELFAEVPAEITGVLCGDLREGAIVRLGRVGDQLVATELADHGIAGAGWARSDGLFQDGRLVQFPGSAPAGAVLAGCDPAIGVAEAMLDGLGSQRLLAVSAPTDSALGALEQGRVHAAVIHGPADDLPESAIPTIRWHLARWQVGLAFPMKVRDSSLEAVLRRPLPFVQRDPAAASQQAFERARSAAGIEPARSRLRAGGHLEAARLAAILGGAAITTEGAAKAFDLRFLGLEDHVVEIWVAERWLGHPGITALGDLLAQSAFTKRVAPFGGYDLADCGHRI